jgi:hypothetical protein
MLKFTKIDCWHFTRVPECESATDLFNKNPSVIFGIKAPLYWWVDTDWIKYYFNMPLNNFEFCQDEWKEDVPLIRYEKVVSQNPNLSPRELMQILPMSTMVEGTLELTYQEIVEVCENYVAGEYYYDKGYGFPNDREWADFCETLLDIKGVRDLVKEEI